MEREQAAMEVHHPAKVVMEYPLPAASQTHEMALVADDLLVISQQPSSTLVKIQLHKLTSRPLAAAQFTLGGSRWAGLHGLFASKLKQHLGRFWATLQFKSELLLLDPVKHDLDSPPQIVQSIKLPPSVWGPHVIVEDGHDLWTSCKGSGHIVRVNHTHPSDFSVYKCSRRPIFVAVHPTSRDVYASLDESSKIFRLELPSGNTSEIAIPSDIGSTPVGLVAGPDGNVWFVLLGGSSGGTGTFGRISSSGDITWFHLPSTAGATAGLIHLAFDSNYNENDHGGLRIWLLGSSLGSDTCIDAIFTTYLQGDPPRIESVETIYLPTPYCATHRVLPHKGGLFVSELNVSILAHVTGTAIAASPVASETSDSFSLWGLGISSSRFKYSDQKEVQGSELSSGSPDIAPTRKRRLAAT